MGIFKIGKELGVGLVPYNELYSLPDNCTIAQVVSYYDRFFNSDSSFRIFRTLNSALFWADKRDPEINNPATREIAPTF